MPGMLKWIIVGIGLHIQFLSNGMISTLGLFTLHYILFISCSTVTTVGKSNCLLSVVCIGVIHSIYLILAHYMRLDTNVFGTLWIFIFDNC